MPTPTYSPRQHRIAAALLLAAADEVDAADARAKLTGRPGFIELALSETDPVGQLLDDADRDELIGVVRALISWGLRGADRGLLHQVIEAMVGYEAEEVES